MVIRQGKNIFWAVHGGTRRSPQAYTTVYIVVLSSSALPRGKIPAAE